jgi:hypothetical protein
MVISFHTKSNWYFRIRSNCIVCNIFIGVLIATFTGHPDQMYTIFPTYIYGSGAIAVAAIFLISKKTIK